MLAFDLLRDQVGKQVTDGQNPECWQERCGARMKLPTVAERASMMLLAVFADISFRLEIMKATITF